MELFFRDGFEAVTIEAISARAEVSRRTFFRYFPTKESVFFHLHEERLGAFRAQLAAAPVDAPPRRAVYEGLLAVGERYQADREHTLAHNRALHASPALAAYDLKLDAQWERTIAAALEASAESRLRAVVEAGAVMGVVRAVLRHWFDAGGAYDLPTAGRAAFAWLEQGLGRG
jgi:AcrR family transcriptional regulator